MADLQAIMAETSKSYDQSRNALNNQINAIATDLAAQKDRINAQYAQQAKTLDNQRNFQAQASSMAASRNGGSFGGTSEIANKKFYQQSYVPAVTQMQTNQANDISSAETQANQNKLSLQQTLAQLNDEANRYALQRYDAAVQAEREEAYRQQQLELERQRIAAQRAAAAAASYYGGGGGGQNLKYGMGGQGNNYQFYNNQTGGSVRFGTYVGQFGGNFNSTARGLLQSMANGGDYNAQRVLEVLKYNPTAKLAQNTGANYKANNRSFLSSTDNNALNTLGLKLVY